MTLNFPKQSPPGTIVVGADMSTLMLNFEDLY